MTALDLKKELKTNVPVVLTISKRAGTYPEMNYQTKEPTGKNTYLYIFRDEKGTEFKYYAKEREEETLGAYKPGDQVKVVRTETEKDGKRIYYQVWDDPKGAIVEAYVEAPVKSPAAAAYQERKIDERKQEEESRWDRIAVGKCIFGYMVALIELGKSPEEAAVLAKDCMKLQEEATEEYIVIHRPSQSL